MYCTTLLPTDPWGGVYPFPSLPPWHRPGDLFVGQNGSPTPEPPILLERSSKNRFLSQSCPQGIFLITIFLSTSSLHRFWTDFGLQIGANMEPKSTPNPPRNNDFAREILRKSIPGLKLSSKYISYYDFLVNILSASILDRFWIPNWSQHRTQIHPKSTQK